LILSTEKRFTFGYASRFWSFTRLDWTDYVGVNRCASISVALEFCGFAFVSHLGAAYDHVLDGIEVVKVGGKNLSHGLHVSSLNDEDARLAALLYAEIAWVLTANRCICSVGTYLQGRLVSLHRRSEITGELVSKPKTIVRCIAIGIDASGSGESVDGVWKPTERLKGNAKGKPNGCCLWVELERPPVVIDGTF
jgi:hypothetical protein